MALLNDFKSKGHLHNTMVILMDDHGIRWGKVRTQVQGKLEERLPFFAILTPHHIHVQNAGLAGVEYINNLLPRYGVSLNNCGTLTQKDEDFAQLERPNRDVVNMHLEDRERFERAQG